VKEYLQAYYAQEVSLQELAGVANMSPFHLARLFRQTVGVPPHAYQIQLRLAHARTLLAQGFEVGYVAHETGFADQSHFTRQFKWYYLVPLFCDPIVVISPLFLSFANKVFKDRGILGWFGELRHSIDAQLQLYYAHAVIVVNEEEVMSACLRALRALFLCLI
jgi:hypothetical protein